MTEIADLDGAINEDPSVVNGAIAKFLAYYTDTAHPLDYAVLIDGPWGAGKTYLVEQFLEESTHIRPLYVSLYGMTKVSQIEDEFYRQLHPVLSSKGMKLAGAVARGLLKATIKVDLNNDGKDDGTLNPSLSEVDFLSGLDNPKGRLLIFDDIERCRIPIAELLGFINGYVEHDGLKAVLIAHEKRIRKKNGKAYAEIKEKLIGQTLTVAADTQAAYDHFLELVGNVRVKAFLLDRRDKIIAIHAQSNKGNLRLLKHALWDFEKFALHFSETHWAKPKVIERAMEAIAALSIEVRAGDLDEDTIQGLIDNHIGRLFRGQAGKPRGVADEVDSRYPQVNFDDTIVPKTLLTAGLFRGSFDGDAIRAALDSNPHYAPKQEQHLWQRATNTFLAEDDEVDEVVELVEKGFAENTITDRGELLHLLGARLWFARLGLIDKPIQTVVDEGKAYIASLAKRGKIALLKKDLITRDDTHFGHRVLEQDTVEWRELLKAYNEASRAARMQTYPALAAELLERLGTEPDEVLLDLVLNNVRSAPYYDEPVLAALDPKRFADRVIELPPREQMQALETLHSRHEFRRPGLESERPWVAEVEKHLNAKLAELRPMTRERLRGSIARNLTPINDDPGSDRSTTTTETDE